MSAGFALLVNNVVVAGKEIIIAINLAEFLAIIGIL